MEDHDRDGFSYPPLPRAGPTPIWATQIPTAVQPVYTQQGHRRTKESAGRRFYKAFLVAFGVWLLVFALFGSLRVQSRRHLGPPSEDYDYPISNDIEASSCATSWPEVENPDFSDFPYSAYTSFDFDLPSKTLLLHSKGGLSNGHLTITSSPDVSKVRVVVTVSYHEAVVRNAAKVCFIERSEGERGVGIFTPEPWHYSGRLFLDVELILPRSDSILHVNGLSTDVSNFSHDVDGLNVYFNDISLRASNGVIHAKPLVASIASVKASNCSIIGVFAVVDSLELKTSNAVLDANVSITGDSGLEKTRDITMETSNGSLNYVVDFGPTAGKAGSFHVKADTSNGKMTGKIVSAPLNSVLAVDAKTSNEKASLALPSTYEGSFAVSTSNAAATFKTTDQNDPACGSDASCRGRHYHLMKVTKSSVKGSVCWDSQNAYRGNVNLGSSNGAVTLYL
ncbi:hypothetical protein C8R45DRAFT_982897 [Mycena sanguinolenta]|nr:hypothetical protein C8R45DRAFT_982897 [Mycena sanguinolenta]